MAAVLPSSSPPSSTSSNAPTSATNPNLTSLPPLITSTTPHRTNVQRPSSYAKNRISAYSTSSIPSQSKSRPASHVFPIFHSSLSYALVRDFAYPPTHPLHYGPPPHSSGLSTPSSETRRLSDPAPTTWEGSRGQWSAAGQWTAAPGTADASYGTQQLPAMTFGDGPPYSEDEDLHSPVVTTSRHRKHKSSASTPGIDGRGRSPIPGEAATDGGGGYFEGVNGGGHYQPRNQGDNGGYLTQPLRNTHLSPLAYSTSGHRDSHFAAPLPDRSAAQPELGSDSDEESSDPEVNRDESRYSKDYQFTIASPDEEMHGKAVALFDFTREHENELPLLEGQVIWVSYRHGQGWLVAEDPKTGESGLVPEEYVRLVRDIEGGLKSLNGELNTPDSANMLSPMSAGPDSATTPTQADHARFSGSGHSPSASNGSNVNAAEKHPPVVSTFSTSSRDLDPYPQHLLGNQAKSAPPQVSHYEGKRGNGKEITTPVLSSPPAEAKRKNKEARKGSKDVNTNDDENQKPGENAR